MSRLELNELLVAIAGVGWLVVNFATFFRDLKISKKLSDLLLESIWLFLLVYLFG